MPAKHRPLQQPKHPNKQQPEFGKKSSSVCEAPLHNSITKSVLSLDEDQFKQLLEASTKPGYLNSPFSRDRRASTTNAPVEAVEEEKEHGSSEQLEDQRRQESEAKCTTLLLKLQDETRQEEDRALELDNIKRRITNNMDQYKKTDVPENVEDSDMEAKYRKIDASIDRSADEQLQMMEEEWQREEARKKKVDDALADLGNPIESSPSRAVRNHDDIAYIDNDNDVEMTDLSGVPPPPPSPPSMRQRLNVGQQHQPTPIHEQFKQGNPEQTVRELCDMEEGFYRPPKRTPQDFSSPYGHEPEMLTHLKMLDQRARPAAFECDTLLGPQMRHGFASLVDNRNVATDRLPLNTATPSQKSFQPLPYEYRYVNSTSNFSMKSREPFRSGMPDMEMNSVANAAHLQTENDVRIIRNTLNKNKKGRAQVKYTTWNSGERTTNSEPQQSLDDLVRLIDPDYVDKNKDKESKQKTKAKKKKGGNKGEVAKTDSPANRVSPTNEEVAVVVNGESPTAESSPPVKEEKEAVPIEEQENCTPVESPTHIKSNRKGISSSSETSPSLLAEERRSSISAENPEVEEVSVTVSSSARQNSAAISYAVAATRASKPNSPTLEEKGAVAVVLSSKSTRPSQESSPPVKTQPQQQSKGVSAGAPSSAVGKGAKNSSRPSPTTTTTTTTTSAVLSSSTAAANAAGGRGGERRTEAAPAAIGANHSATAGSVAGAAGKGAAAAVTLTSGGPASSPPANHSEKHTANGRVGGGKKDKHPSTSSTKMESGGPRSRIGSRGRPRPSSDDGEEEFVSADEAPVWTEEHPATRNSTAATTTSSPSPRTPSAMVLDGANFRADNEAVDSATLSKAETEEEFITVKGKKKVATPSTSTVSSDKGRHGSTGGGSLPSSGPTARRDIRGVDEGTRRSSVGAHLPPPAKGGEHERRTLPRDGGANASGAHVRHLGDFIENAKHQPAGKGRGKKQSHASASAESSPSHHARGDGPIPTSSSSSGRLTSSLSVETSMSTASSAGAGGSAESTPMMSPEGTDPARTHVQNIMAMVADDTASSSEAPKFSYADAAKNSSRQGSPPQSTTPPSGGDAGNASLSPRPGATAPDNATPKTKAKESSSSTSDISFFYDPAIDRAKSAVASNAETAAAVDGGTSHDENDIQLNVGGKIMNFRGASQSGGFINERHEQLTSLMQKHWEFFATSKPAPIRTASAATKK